MEKINIAEILKDCPKGMELDCTICDNVCLDEVTPNMIKCFVKNDVYNTIYFHHDGTYLPNPNAKCVIFPKGKTTWEGFQRPFKDGDIVVADDGVLTQMFILKDVKSHENDSYDGCCYFGWDFDDNQLFHEGIWGFDRLATEEEKEKLFKVINDNGYKWDPETKTLEKLIEPKFKVGDRVLWNYDTETPRTILEVKLTSKGGYVYWINCEGCTSRWWDETELTPIPNKFDITTLKPFDKVLVRDYDTHKWRCALYDRYVEDNMRKFATIIGLYTQCIPYESNEHLLGTINDCDDYYKNWE